MVSWVVESSFIYSLIHSVIFVGYLLHDALWTEQGQESQFENETNSFKKSGNIVEFQTKLKRLSSKSKSWVS